MLNAYIIPFTTAFNKGKQPLFVITYLGLGICKMLNGIAFKLKVNIGKLDR